MFPSFILVAHNLLALVCAWIAFRRARNVAALFWFLYAVSLLTLLIPTVFGAYDTGIRAIQPVGLDLARAFLSVWRPHPDDALPS